MNLFLKYMKNNIPMSNLVTFLGIYKKMYLKYYLYITSNHK